MVEYCFYSERYHRVCVCTCNAVIFTPPDPLQWRLHGQRERLSGWSTNRSLDFHRCPWCAAWTTFGNVFSHPPLPPKKGSKVKVIPRCDHEAINVSLHARSVWFARAILTLQANPRANRGNVLEELFLNSSDADTWISDFLWSFHQAGTRGGMSSQGVRRNGPVKLRLTGKRI